MSPSALPQSSTKEDLESMNKILKCLFGTMFPPPADVPFPSYWFRATSEQDEEMKSLFSTVYQTAVSDEAFRLRWSRTREGRIA
jgi:hypothetical protein